MYLKEAIWIEKYRPQILDDLILNDKESIVKFLIDNRTIPNFLLVSSNPGTGKTSLAKLIIKETNADSITINSSDERGLDTIRERVKKFATALSSNNKKRCVFLDEADGMTKQAQDSLRNLMETYSDNCFFILTANYIDKINSPIQSRCVTINFELPKKDKIKERLKYIIQYEKVQVNDNELERLVEYNFPDIRSMINILQTWHITGKKDFPEDKYLEFWDNIKKKNIQYIYAETYSGLFNINEFTHWLWEKLFQNSDKYGLTKTSQMAGHLAEIEKHNNLGANQEIIFISEIIKIMEIL